MRDYTRITPPTGNRNTVENDELTLRYIRLPIYQVVHLQDLAAAAIWKKYWIDAAEQPGEPVEQVA